MRIKLKRKKVVATGRLSVLFVEDKERGMWSAQCLEHDMAVQGKTLLDVNTAMQEMIACQIAVSRKLNRKPFAHLGKAPKIFHDLYAKSQMRINSQPVHLPSRARGLSSYPRIAEQYAAVG